MCSCGNIYSKDFRGGGGGGRTEREEDKKIRVGSIEMGAKDENR